MRKFSIKCFLHNKRCWQFFIFLIKMMLKFSYYSLLTIALRILVNMTQDNILVSNDSNNEKAGTLCMKFIRRWIEQVPKFLQYKLASDDNQPVWACPWKSKVHKR